MLNTHFDLIRAECSGQATLAMVYEISHHHRIQASPGFRQAAQGVMKRLEAWGLPVETLSFVASHDTAYWGEMMFQEWEAQAGTLHLVEPQAEAGKLADARDEPLSLIPRSASFDGECEMVMLDKGEEAEEYAGLDVAGKIVMTRGNVMRVHTLAVQQFGAAGIVFDGMRSLGPVCPPMALPDAIQYTSFWWSKQDHPCFGFALSPRRGQWLRDLVKKQAAQGRPVRARVHVDSRLYDGAIEDVVATIPALSSQQEVIVVSHLCHPAPCANDNASGAAANLEAARALQHLIRSGALPPPQRIIRFVWLPEMTGLYPYLAARQSELGRVVAGLNLDMVGEDQAQTGSVMLIEHPSQAMPSFAPDLLEYLREQLFAEGQSHAHQGSFPLFRHAVTPFSGGSDHYILSDPQVGIPTPMLIQWPDKFYHTTADTIDKVSPDSLARAATLAATYAYWLATAGPAEANWLAHEMNTRFKARVTRRAQAALTQAWPRPAARPEGEVGASQAVSSPHVQRVLDFMLERHCAALDTLTRLGGKALDVQPFKAEARACAEAEWQRCRPVVGLPQATLPDLPYEVATLKPRRTFPAQVGARPYARQLDEAERQAYWAFGRKLTDDERVLQTIAMYWADGQRSLAQIVDCVELETGQRRAAMLAEFFEWMRKMGLVVVKTSDAPRR